MNIFATADEHYGHLNILTHCERPFATVEDMTECLISRHNERVKPGDLVYHLGDMFWRTFTEQAAMRVMDRLNGQHFYVSGNHEELMEKHECLRNRFEWVRDLTKIRPSTLEKSHPGIVLCHYAMRVWEKSHKGSWQLYGHSHGELSEDGSLSLDVGVDAWDFYPVSLEEVAAKMEQYKSWNKSMPRTTEAACQQI